MNFMEIGSFYGELAKEKAIGESLAKRIQGISSEAELQKLIQDEILPLARKMGYDFSEKDFFEYERTVSQRLSDEDLLNVTGGFSLKSALLSGGIFSLAMLGFGALSPVQADAMVPKAAVESATGGVVAGARNDAVNTVEAQVQAAIKPELKGKVSQEDVIKPLLRIISASNTSAEQKGSAIKLLLNLVSDDKKEEIQEAVETIKSTLPADLTITEEVAKETLEEAGQKIEDVMRPTPFGGLEADKKMVLSSTGKVAKEAKDSQEIEISQTDYGYLLDAWNGAEALVYKLTGVTESFRFLNPTNRPTLVKKDGEKYFRWKYNEDSGDGFGELMRILFPCSGGQRIVVDGGAPNVPAFSRDCQPTAKLMAQIAALLYKYRTATSDEKEQIKSELENFIKELNKNQVNKEKSELEAQKQNFETRFNIYIDAVSKLATEQKNIFNDIFDNTIAEKGRQAAKTKFENNLKALADSQKSVAEKITAANDIIAILMKDFDKIKTLDGKDELKQKFNKCKKDAQSLLDSLIIASGAGSTSNAHKLLAAYNQNIQQLETIAHLSNYIAGSDHFFARHFAGFGIDLSTPQGFVAANTLHRLLTSAFFAIDNQEYEGEDYNAATPDKFAPKYFVEKMLMNFCIEKFNTAEDLNEFYNEAKSLIKHVPTTASLTQAKQAGERIENTLNLLKKVEVSPLSPYKSGTAQNGATYQIGQVENGKVTFKNGTFADCADIAVRHVVNLLGYSVNKNWNVFFDGLLDQNGNFTKEAEDKLEARLNAFKAAADRHAEFEFLPLKDRLQLFFYHQSKVGVDATDVITRTLWEYAICNMNDQANLENGALYQIRYNKDKNYELDTGHINSLKLVYNIAKALGLGTDKLDDAKAAIDELEVTFEQAKKDDPTGAKEGTKDKLNTALKKAATATYQLINPGVKVNVSAVIDNRYPRDIWGTIQAKEASSFDLVQNSGHGKVTHDPNVAVPFDTAELKSDVDKLLGKKTSKENSDIAKKTQLNKFHILFGNFLSKDALNRWNRGDFKEGDPKYYKDFQALRFLKVAQGEEENTTRLKDELENNPYVRDAKVTINLREVQGKKTTTKEKPLALFAYENYCIFKSDFFSGAGQKDLVKKEIDFLTSFEEYEKEEEDNGFTFVITNGKASLCSYDGNGKEIEVPNQVNGCPVTKIGHYCFYKNQTIEKVTIPSTVEEIGKSAFDGAKFLNTVDFKPDSQLKIIGEYSFTSCRELSKITIPKSVERIEHFAFLSCAKLENITFENREKPIFIETNAFSSCLFSNITFPHNVKFGDNKLLGLPKNLKTLTFTGPGEIKKENILKFLPRDGASKFFKHNIEELFGGKDSMQIDDKLTIDLWGSYLREDGTLDLSQFDVATFKTFRFAENNCIKKVIWPQGIDAIPEKMFKDCDSLEEITIPKTVNKVGKEAFYWCENLAKVTFEAGRTENLSIDSSIFDSNYKLTEVNIVDKIAFNGRKLEKIVIDADAENVQFNDYCFGYNGVNENLRIYVRDNAMKEKITKNKRLNVKPENVIVGIPQRDE